MSQRQQLKRQPEGKPPRTPTTKPSKLRKVDGKETEDTSSDSAPAGDAYKEQWKALGGWFLGPRAENRDKFMEMFNLFFNKHADMRRQYFPTDPAYITEEIKSSKAYRSEMEHMKNELMKTNDDLINSVPFFSPRYQAHMNWDVSMPAILGYISAMLYNQNNVDTAASPVTTLYEKRVGLQLCDMLGYDISDSPTKAWGHITCGGSIANIEALWAARNLKFHPLAVKYAIENNEGILTPEQKTAALAYKVTVAGQERKMIQVPLAGCGTWELLNLDVDEICNLTNGVTTAAGLEEEKIPAFDSLIEKWSFTSLGIRDFMELHSLKNSAVYFCPANNHYSWPKAGTLLGLGTNALIPVPLDVNFRQDVNELRVLLKEKKDKKIPVISVLAVIGSTEESAVDPLVGILALREEMKTEGLNFCVLADGAWGGYFKTMLRKKAVPKKKHNIDYVPFCPLSDYVKAQYEALQHADTITIDPHKSGFCPYPAGALCYRNGTMRALIAYMHPEVYHGSDDPTMGVYGIEGSKPGAAPTGVLMSHNVIGLDNLGYGRILGQCTSTAKLFYCLWLVLARDEDPFICQPIQTIPDGYTMEQAKAIIKEKILGKPMYEIEEDIIAKDFILQVGPDTLINTFVVNPKGNRLVSRSNALQKAMSNELSVLVGSSAKRVPLVIMQSGLNAVNHGQGLVEYKKRLGLDSDTLEDLSVMVNTTMNPWQWNESIALIGDILRISILNCMGKLDDAETQHSFVVCGDIREDMSFFAEFIPSFDNPSGQYHAIAKFQMVIDPGKRALIDSAVSPLVVTTVQSMKLYSLLKEPPEEGILVKLFDSQEVFMCEVLVKLIDVPRYQHLDMSFYAHYPERQTYFLYGDEQGAYLSHCFSKAPDFQQIVSLDGPPHSLCADLLDVGIEVTLDDLSGEPMYIGSEIQDPLQATSYTISFRGREYVQMKNTIYLTRPDSKVYFNVLN